MFEKPRLVLRFWGYYCLCCDSKLRLLSLNMWWEPSWSVKCCFHNIYKVVKVIWRLDIIFLEARHLKRIKKKSCRYRYKDDGERGRAISLNWSFYSFWSELPFLPDFITTVYEPHTYLTLNLLKLTSSNVKCFYSSL